MKKLLNSIKFALEYMIVIDPVRYELKPIPIKIKAQNLRMR